MQHLEEEKKEDIAEAIVKKVMNKSITEEKKIYLAGYIDGYTATCMENSRSHTPKQFA